jgi:hypothetical protein
MEILRTSPAGREVLSQNGEELVFNSKNPVEFQPVNGAGSPAKFIVNGVLYYLRVNRSYLYYLDNKFVLQDFDQISGRVFLYLPPGPTYTPSSNLAGFFFVSGNTFSETRGIWTGLTDQITSNFTSKNCSPSCAGKKCSDDNGCGLPCGCAKGGVCSEDGICLAKDPVSSGCENCPIGTRCSIDSTGKASCQPITDTTMTMGIVLFLLLVILIVVLIMVFLNFSEKQSLKS